MIAVILACLGLCAGVWVEGIISSYHYNESFGPLPRCRACGTVAPAQFLLPIVGALRLSHCPHCTRPRRDRAIQVQLATAATFVALGLPYSSQPLLLIVSLAEAVILVAILFIDLELRLIPHLLIGVLLLLALGSATAWPAMGWGSALLGGAIGYGSFLVFVLLARLFFGSGALGMGDAHLALAIGCITGYPQVVLALSYGICLGGAGGLILLLVRRGSLRTTMPYGPYLILAVLYVLAHGNTLSPLIRL